MRLTAILFVLLTAGSVFADRIFLVPTGKRLTRNLVRAEFMSELSRDRSMAWLGTGIGESFELELTGEKLTSDNYEMSFDASYNFLVPVTDFMPGVSFGVQDVLNETERGRGLYAAVTYRIGNYDEHNQDVPTEVTFGFWDRNEGLLFAGAKLPFSEHFKLLVEHDSLQFTAGIELSPYRASSFKVMFRESEVLVGFSFQSKF